MDRTKLIALALGALMFLPVAASANPTSANLNMRYRSNGSLRVDVKFDDAITSPRCIARHRSRLYYEGQQVGEKGIINRATVSRVLRKGQKSTSLRATSLKGAAQKNGEDPILAMQVRIVCGSDVIDSDAEARFVKCGRGVERLSLSKYFTELKRRLALSR